jgi:hypothetical protein
LKKKIVQANGRAAEGVRLDDVGAGFQVTAVDFLDDVGFGEQQNFEATLEVLAFPVLETAASVFGFR